MTENTQQSSILPSVNVTLGEKTYAITPLPIGPAKAWRERVREPFRELTGIIAGYQDLQLVGEDGQVNAAGIASLIGSAEGLLLGAVDLISDLVIDYAPALQADRDYIDNHAYDAQMVAAFKEVLRLAFPLGEIRSLVNGLKNPMISMNSQRPSGASLAVIRGGKAKTNGKR